ncbi:MAG: sigma-70 family RNA polymerase sigma factor, partial [Eubacteriaceae bacterium]|nr:sigma-70 family RNA polymerase sigma factor [Eubacteriaceae bacterium]
EEKYINILRNISPSEALPEGEALASENSPVGLTDCEQARNMLIEHNLRLVVYIARKFESNLHNLEDMVSIGTIGLIKAVKTYDANKGIKLATYASRCIENEILMYLRKTSKQKGEVSLDEPLKSDTEGNELVLADVISGGENPIYEQMEKQSEVDMLHEALRRLEQNERDLIDLRFGINGKQRKTQKEVAKIMSISQSYISRLEKKIVLNLKKEMNRLLK